jgi:hypothetical protein
MITIKLRPATLRARLLSVQMPSLIRWAAVRPNQPCKLPRQTGVNQVLPRLDGLLLRFWNLKTLSDFDCGECVHVD